VNLDLSLAGLLIGLLVGMTGMGGGSLMTPMLVLVFGFKPTVAIGTDILHGAIFKSFGAVRHRQLGHVHARLTFWMLLGSAPASLVGVALSTWLKHHYGEGFEDTAQQLLGVALVIGGLAFLAKAFLHSASDDAPFLLTNRDPGDRCAARALRRLRRRADVGRLRDVLRAGDADRLPAHRGEDRGHGHLPRGAAPVGGGHWPLRGR
jgi:uncharacterized membrane protein YfcA